MDEDYAAVLSDCLHVVVIPTRATSSSLISVQLLRPNDPLLQIARHKHLDAVL